MIGIDPRQRFITSSLGKNAMEQCYAWINADREQPTRKCRTTTDFRCPHCQRPACSDHRDELTQGSGRPFCRACLEEFRNKSPQAQEELQRTQHVRMKQERLEQRVLKKATPEQKTPISKQRGVALHGTCDKCGREQMALYKKGKTWMCIPCYVGYDLQKPMKSKYLPSERQQVHQPKPRVWRRRFAKLGRTFKRVRRGFKSIGHLFSMKYVLRRLQRTRRANQREELRRQGFDVPK